MLSIPEMIMWPQTAIIKALEFWNEVNLVNVKIMQIMIAPLVKKKG